MNRRNIYLNCLIIIISISSLALLSCSHFKPSQKQSDLKQIIDREWTARTNKDWGAVYDLSASSFKKKAAREEFIKHANTEVINFSIKEIQPDPSGKKAVAVIEYTALQNGFKIPMLTKEEWLMENGKWRLNLLPGTQFPAGNKK